MFATNFIAIRDHAEELELIFSSRDPKIDLDTIKNVISGFGANDPVLLAALMDPDLGWAWEGYADVRDYILNGVLGEVRKWFAQALYEGYSYKKFVGPAGDVTYRFWSDHGRGDDECGDLLESMKCLLAIAGVYEVSGATGFVYR